MSSRNQKNTTSPVSKKLIQATKIQYPPVLSQQDIKRLMTAQILGGMLANPRKDKFEHTDLTLQAIACVERIIDLT